MGTRFNFTADWIKGELVIEPVADVIEKPTANAAFMAACAFVRKIPVSSLSVALAKMLRAEAAGPILNPSAWTGNAFNRHSAYIDVMRRMEDLRQALITADQVYGLDPYIFEDD